MELLHNISCFYSIIAELRAENVFSVINRQIFLQYFINIYKIRNNIRNCLTVRWQSVWIWLNKEELYGKSH